LIAGKKGNKYISPPPSPSRTYIESPEIREERFEVEPAVNIEGMSGRGVGTSVEISRTLDSYVYKQQQQQQTESLSSLGISLV
jgi:hypothetical protein